MTARVMVKFTKAVFSRQEMLSKKDKKCYTSPQADMGGESTVASQSSRPTIDMWNQIKRSPSLQKFLEWNEPYFMEPAFVQYINEMRVEKKLVREQIFFRAGIEPAYGHQIFRGKRHPSRDKVLQLAFGFPMTLQETRNALAMAKKRELYPKIKRDAVISFCLNHGKSLTEVQEMLYECDLPILGEDRD